MADQNRIAFSKKSLNWRYVRSVNQIGHSPFLSAESGVDVGDSFPYLLDTTE